MPQPLSKVVRTYTRIVKVNDYDLGVVYRKGDTVIISDYHHPQEWVVRITQLLVYGPVFNQYYHFIDGEYFVPKTVHGNFVTDSWTQQPWMVKRDYERLRVQPMNQLQRKVMLYPHTRIQNNFLTIDPDGLLVIKDLQVPYYPEVNEVVKVTTQEKEVILVVLTVTDGVVKGNTLRKVRGSTRWVQGHELEVSLLQVRCPVKHTRNCGHYILDEET